MSVDSNARLERVRELLATKGSVRISALSDEFGVSAITVRRDLDTLCDLGHAQRIRGGALALGPRQHSDRYGQQSHAKNVIADKLLKIVEDGVAISIDASTTMLRLAARLTESSDLTVLTNSIEAARVLEPHPGVSAIVSGGRVDPRTGSLVGPLAVHAAGTMRLRQLFVSASGIEPGYGISDMTLEEAELKQSFAGVSAQIIVGIDSTKLGRSGVARSLAMEQIDVLVTELSPSDARLAAYAKHCELL